MTPRLLPIAGVLIALFLADDLIPEGFFGSTTTQTQAPRSLDTQEKYPSREPSPIPQLLSEAEEEALTALPAVLALREEPHIVESAARAQPTLANASLLQMTEQCFVAIRDYALPSGEDLELVGSSLDWDNPGPFDAVEFSTTDRSKRLIYINLGADVPAGNRRNCSLTARSDGVASFLPDFRAWLTNDTGSVGFVPQKVSQNARLHQSDLVYHWMSRARNARGCQMFLRFEERSYETSREVKVIVTEREETCR